MALCVRACVSVHSFLLPTHKLITIVAEKEFAYTWKLFSLSAKKINPSPARINFPPIYSFLIRVLRADLTVFERKMI